MKQPIVQVAIAIIFISTAGAAPKSMKVAHQPLPILTEAPTQDSITFVAKAGTELAKQYLTTLLTWSPDPVVEPPAHPAPDPVNLRLISVRTDASGRMFLYQPCDMGYHSIVIVEDKRFTQLAGAQSYEYAIKSTRSTKRLTTFKVDPMAGASSGKPNSGPAKIEIATTRLSGVYRISIDDDQPTLVADMEAAQKLDIVVNICKRAKRFEFDFTKKR
jgi:hypothetical protein